MNKKKNILFVIPSYNTGGTTSSLKSIIHSNLSKEYNLFVFSLSKEEYIDNSFEPFDIGHNRWTSFLYTDRTTLTVRSRYLTYSIVTLLFRFLSFIKINVKQIIEKKARRAIVRERVYDYVVSFSESSSPRFVSLFKNKKIVWIHCDYAMMVQDRESEGRLFNQFDYIVCVSDFTRESFCSIFPDLSDKTIFIYNLIDSNHVLSLSNEVINDMQTGNDVYNIVSVGRVCDVKRYSSIPGILSSVNKVVRDDIAVKWYVIGPIAERTEYEKLMESIKRYDVSDSVIYLGARKNPYPYIKNADLLVSVSLSEACPMIFNEAKVLNTLIVSSNFGSAKEFITDAKDGYVSDINLIDETISSIINKKLHSTSSNQFDAVGYNSAIEEQLSALFGN